MSYTFEMIDEVITEKTDDFVELRKGETNVYSALDLWKGDVVTLRRESGQPVLAVIMGFDEESMLMNALQLEAEKEEGKYVDEATVMLTNSDEQKKYYVNCMKPFYCKGTCIGDLYGTVILKDINNIAIDISVAFGLKAAIFDAPCALNTRHVKPDNDKKKGMPGKKDVTAIYSAALKKQNADLKQEIQVLRGKLEKPKESSNNQTDIKNLEGRIKALTTESTGKDKRIKELTEEKATLETKVSGLNQIIENKNRELKTSKDLSKAQRNTITTNSAELKRIQNERDTLTKKNTDLSNVVMIFKAEKKATEKSMDALKKENEQLKKSINDLSENRNKYTNRIEELVAQLDSLGGEKDDLIRDIENLRDENAQLLSKMDNVKAEAEESSCEDKPRTSEVREVIITAPSTDLEMRIHDLELSLTIYKELYKSVMDQLIENR